MVLIGAEGGGDELTNLQMVMSIYEYIIAPQVSLVVAPGFDVPCRQSFIDPSIRQVLNCILTKARMISYECNG